MVSAAGKGFRVQGLDLCMVLWASLLGDFLVGFLRG